MAVGISKPQQSIPSPLRQLGIGNRCCSMHFQFVPLAGSYSFGAQCGQYAWHEQGRECGDAMRGMNRGTGEESIDGAEWGGGG